jgi:hypothetical protein
MGAYINYIYNQGQDYGYQLGSSPTLNTKDTETLIFSVGNSSSPIHIHRRSCETMTHNFYHLGPQVINLSTTIIPKEALY